MLLVGCCNTPTIVEVEYELPPDVRGLDLNNPEMPVEIVNIINDNPVLKEYVKFLDADIIKLLIYSLRKQKWEYDVKHILGKISDEEHDNAVKSITDTISYYNKKEAME